MIHSKKSVNWHRSRISNRLHNLSLCARILDVQKNLSREILYLESRRQFRFGSFNDGFGQIPNIKVSIFMGLSYAQWFKSSLTGKMISEIKRLEKGKRVWRRLLLQVFTTTTMGLRISWTHRIIELWNSRITQVGGYLGESLVQAPAQSGVSSEVRNGSSGLRPVRSWIPSRTEMKQCPW